MQLIKNIIWDTDGDAEITEILGSEYKVPDHIHPDDIADYLSDITGYLVKSFTLTLPTPKGRDFTEHLAK